MKLMILAAALLLASPLALAYSAKELSLDPHAYNSDGVCYIRGSIWARNGGAVPNTKLSLVEVGGPLRIEVTTDAEGFYEAQIPSRPGTVFRERLGRELRKSSVQVGSRLPAVTEPTFVCHEGRVSIGTLTYAPRSKP
jgi:hypothetical protein